MSKKFINTRLNDCAIEDNSMKEEKEASMNKQNEITIDYVRYHLRRKITLNKGGIFLMNSGSIKISN
jgi:hypothetical protein